MSMSVEEAILKLKIKKARWAYREVHLLGYHTSRKKLKDAIQELARLSGKTPEEIETLLKGESDD